jgi:anti-sigma-K factor RskA
MTNETGETIMPVPLDQLDREAAAMLYVAGELEPAEREAFERRLASETGLAAEVERLRAAQRAITASLESLDAQQRLPVNEGVAVRRASRAIGAWLTARTVSVMPPVKKGWPFPWWSYPVAAAACLIVGFLVWSTSQDVQPMSALPEAKEQFTLMEKEQDDLADWLTGSLEVTADATLDQEIDRLMGRWDGLNVVYVVGTEENTQ